MLATIYQLNFAEPGGVTLSEFFSKLCIGKVLQFDKMHEMYMHDEGEYYSGLLVQYRDQKAFLTVNRTNSGDPDDPSNSGKKGDQGDPNDPVLTREQLNDRQLLEFNIFVLSKSTWKALYLHYPRSCSWNKFGTLCKKECSKLQAAKRDFELSNMPPGYKPKKWEKEIRKRYRTPLKWNVELTVEDFLALVEKAHHVYDFGYSASTEILEKPEFAPASKVVKTKRANVSVIFHEDQIVGSKEWIKTVLGVVRDKIKRARSRINLDGEDHVIHLLKNPSSQGQVDYDDIAKEMANKRLSQFYTIKTITGMVKQAKKMRII